MAEIRRVSKGQIALHDIIKKLFPLERFVTEYSIGERLRLDIFYPKYNLAIEYHGRQHYEYVEHFHGDIHGFNDSLNRDQRKADICEEKGIALLIFKYDDSLTEESILQRIQEVIDKTDYVPKEQKPKRKAWKPTVNSITREERLKKEKEYRRIAYRRMKEYKKNSG